MDWLRRNGLLLVAVIALGVGALWLKQGLLRESGQDNPGKFEIGGPFALTTHDGRAVTQATWPGKLLLITFGYRFCPDICPTNLQTIAGSLDKLGADAERVQPLFVTIDPERDTKEGLASFVPMFSPRLIGLTGTPDQLAAIVKAFRVYYRKVPGGTPTGYTMDHSAFTFLTNDKGIVLALFGHETTPEQMADGVRKVLAKH